MEERAQIHEAAITDSQIKDHIIASYQNKAKRCSHELEVMAEARTSKDVVIDVIQDLIIDIIT